MYDYFYRLYLAIADNTGSELVLFFLILFASVTPAYYLIYRDRKSSRQHDKDRQAAYLEREREIVKVIKEMGESHNGVAREFSAVVAENTAVIATLKDLLHNHGSESKLADARIYDKIEQVTARLHKRIDKVEGDTALIKSDIDAIKADTAAIKELLMTVSRERGRQ